MNAQAKSTSLKVSTARGVIEAVARLIPALRERQAVTEQEGKLPIETVQELDAAGVYRVSLPPQYDGIKVTAVEHYEIVRTLARGCQSTAWLAMAHNLTGSIACLFPTETADEVLGSPWVGPRIANAGGPSRAHSGVARKVPGGWMIKGVWPFATGCMHSKFVQLGCFISDEDQPPSMAIMPASKVTILDDWKTKAMSGTESNSVSIKEEMFIPDSHFLAPSDMPAALKRQAEAGARAKPGGVHFPGLVGCGVMIGAAEAALEEFLAQVKKRGIAYTDYKKQSEAPITHMTVGQVHCMIQAARALAEENARMIDAKNLAGQDLGEEEYSRFSVELSYVWRLCSDAAALLFRAAGASAIFDKNPLQRAWRDLVGGSKHAFIHFETFIEDYGRVRCGLPVFGAASRWIVTAADAERIAAKAQ